MRGVWWCIDAVGPTYQLTARHPFTRSRSRSFASKSTASPVRYAMRNRLVEDLTHHGLLWVKTGKARVEQIESASPPTADISAMFQHVRFGPEGDMLGVGLERRLRAGRRHRLFGCLLVGQRSNFSLSREAKRNPAIKRGLSCLGIVSLGSSLRRAISRRRAAVHHQSRRSAN